MHYIIFLFLFLAKSLFFSFFLLGMVGVRTDIFILKRGRIYPQIVIVGFLLLAASILRYPRSTSSLLYNPSIYIFVATIMIGKRI